MAPQSSTRLEWTPGAEGGVLERCSLAGALLLNLSRDRGLRTATLAWWLGRGGREGKRAGEREGKGE